MISIVPSMSLLLSFFLLKSAIAFTRPVYNGEDLQGNIRSFLVKLEFKNYSGLILNEGYGLCSGSIISVSWVITAGHCARQKYDFILIVDETEGRRRVIAEANMKDVVTHPSYPFITLEHDIALVPLKQGISIYADKKPVQFAALRPEFGSAIVAGYGRTEVGAIPPRQGNVTIKKCLKCLLTNTICSQGVVRTGPGDSGGPLIYNGVLIGVIQGVEDTDFKTKDMTCDIYSSIASNIDWIKEVTKIY